MPEMADSTRMESPRLYTAFGLRVRSEIELPELLLPANDGRSPEITIRLGNVPTESMKSDSPLMWIKPANFGVGYPDIARFAVTNGDQITVDAAAGADESAIRLFLLGPIFALLLHQRGLLVLHASAVNIDGQVVAFAAEKGEGKSTLAAGMHARGHAMFTDDLLPIDVTSKQLLVAPAYPQLKLYPEAAAQLNDSPELLERVHPGFEKRAQPAKRDFPTSPLPLARIFILETGAGERIEPIAVQQRFVELIRHSYLAQLVRSTGEESLHFSQVVNLATRVPMAKIIRRRDLLRLADVAKLIEKDLAQPIHA
jgi:hypothetical protein